MLIENQGETMKANLVTIPRILRPAGYISANAEEALDLWSGLSSAELFHRPAGF